MNPSLRTVLRLYAVVIALAAVTGAACTFFLWALEAVTVQRFAHPWLLWLLPVAGFGVGLLYHYRGGGSDAGNNLILDRIHEPGGGVPRRMAPLVLLGTLATHLCGGSAGREGTAVQMGGSIAGAFCRHLRLGAADIPVVLMAGVAAGFGAVFGTPLAGTVFALEVLTIGRIRHSALLPCFVAALTGDWTCRALGATHTHYQINWHASPLTASALTDVDVLLLAKIALAALGFGLAARLFAGASHWLSGTLRRLIPWAPLRPVAGGLAVIALVLLTGTRDFLGLGVWSADPEAVSIVRLFTSPEIHPWAWLGKLVFTVVTLSAGFKGGEVTPLFFIGAALGNALAGVLGAPPDLFAALGFVAIFAGATNTPLACTLMGIELFGATHSVYLGAACFLAWKVSGSASIYASQRRTPPDDVPALRPEA